MIPVNDALTCVFVALAATAGLILLLARTYWLRRVQDAYQDGHSAGIATQIGRQQRALRTGAAVSGIRATQVVALIDAETGRDTGASMIGDRFIPAPPAITQTQWGPIDDFPAGLPDGLREWAATSMATSDAASWAAAR